MEAFFARVLKNIRRIADICNEHYTHTHLWYTDDEKVFMYFEDAIIEMDIREIINIVPSFLREYISRLENGEVINIPLFNQLIDRLNKRMCLVCKYNWSSTHMCRQNWSQFKSNEVIEALNSKDVSDLMGLLDVLIKVPLLKQILGPKVYIELYE